MPTLDTAALSTALTTLPGWRVEANALQRDFSFRHFDATMAFVNGVAGIAQSSDHHPQMTVEYARCSVRWWTHDAGGITMLDVAAAHQTSALA
jgi:4a-hydroxytetrahydrobiopterin dehydratase